MKKITIVGGGFGGVKTALELAKDAKNQITLISATSHFQYYPALYSTATGGSHRESWISLDKIFGRYNNVTLLKDTIVTIDPESQTLSGAEGSTYHYETLVLALGSVTTYFGIKGLDQYSYGIKSEREIRELQDHFFYDMRDGVEDEKHYVIVGAGPTGVELAGALGEYLRKLRRHFNIREHKVKISLVEAAPRVLPRMNEASSRRVEKRLRKLGITLRTNTKVGEQTIDSLTVNNRPLKTQTVIWTSGVANAPFYKDNEQHFTLNERGKVVVDDHMQARAKVYVIGDNAATPYAGLAQTALHDAIFVAQAIMGSQKKYRAVLPSSVVPVGDNWAVFEWRWLRFGGRPGAWLREAADIIGYSDVLPIGWALGTWRAGKTKTALRIPDKLQD